MPREIITVQVGQCGNQIGWKFWDLALREHGSRATAPVFDEAMSTFFRNVDPRTSRDVVGERVGPGGERISALASLRARAVLVDTEEGVLSQVLGSRLGRELFDRSTQVVSDVSGAGNNWAHGYYEYGSRYTPMVMEQVRRALEAAESPQAFLLLHSLGGGTGSGLGTSVLHGLTESFPELDRITCSVFPSDDDDVITSPYNAALATRVLADDADAVLPIENARLQTIVEGSGSGRSGGLSSSSSSSSLSGGGGGGDVVMGGRRREEGTAFDEMNGVAAHVLTGLTASARFEGPLNVDLNEIATNLVPFPRLHFLAPALAPRELFAARSRGGKRSVARSLGHSIGECFDPKHQLCSIRPREHTVLACALLVRGKRAGISDAQRAIGTLRPSLRMPAWNRDGFKMGLCAVPPPGCDHAVLGLCNSAAQAVSFASAHKKFYKLWAVRAHAHHYTEYGMEAGEMDQAAESLLQLADGYKGIDKAAEDPTDPDDPDIIDSVILSFLGDPEGDDEGDGSGVDFGGSGGGGGGGGGEVM